MNREEKKHQKQIQSKIPQLCDSLIYESFPDNEILPYQTAINMIKQQTDLEDQEIADLIDLFKDVS